MFKGIKSLLARRKFQLINFLLPQQYIFSNIYKKGGWSKIESVSGPGSLIENTVEIRNALPKLISEYKIQSILDIPCGDFNWMKEVDLTNLQYCGMDIVPDLIIANKAKYEGEKIHFKNGNLTNDKLEKVDLILCRDCLVHLSYKNIFKALKNICTSSSEYLLTTSFPLHQNKDIVTGDWRPLNLNAAPFNFPIPLLVINEKCTEENGIFHDKSMCLWRIKDLPKF